ncbi:MAG: PDZ domain-containing protein [Campylobacteraceae bacterium]|nr:PDZ domain-containing protein [Campylobacteraceae bacterium]
MKSVIFVKTILALVVIFMFSSCASSGYADFYKPMIDVKTANNIKLLNKNEEPQIHSSDNMANDIIDVLSNHYVMIGYSSFNGIAEDENGLRKLCKKIGATLALYNIKYSDTRQGALLMPQQQTTYAFGNALSQRNSLWYSGTSTTTSMQQIPYSVRRYDHEAAFFAPFTEKLKFGVAWGTLTNEMRQKIQKNSGAIVKVVYKSTPAFRANILIGDVITKINGIDIDENNVERILDALPSGEKIDVVVMRGTHEKSIEVVLD